MQNLVTRIAIAAIVALLGSTAAFAQQADAAPAQSRALVYDITISGVVSGRSFQRPGVLVIAATVTRTTTNGVNPVDFCIQSGFPAGLPETGAIRFGTNAACFGGRTLLDVAFVSVAGNRVVAQPDGRLTSTYINTFTSSPGIAASLFSPTGGTVGLELLAGGGLRGSIALSGYCGAFCGQTTYQATIVGRARA